MNLHQVFAKGSTVLAIVAGGLLVGQGQTSASASTQPGQAVAALYTQAGEPVGTVTFSQQTDKVMVRVDLLNLPVGFHGFHVHTNGVCDGSASFTTAGGHLNLDSGDMMGMAGMYMSGEMTNLQVTGDGTSAMSFLVDRFTVADLVAEGGRSVMVHAGPDNFRNIPERYGVTLDQATMDTGDAGPRIACGVIQPA